MLGKGFYMKNRVLIIAMFFLMPLACYGMHFERKRYEGVSYLVPVYNTESKKNERVDHSESQSQPTFLQRLMAFFCATENKREQPEFARPSLGQYQLRRRATCPQLPGVEEW